MEKYILILQLVSSDVDPSWQLENFTREVYEQKKDCEKSGIRMAITFENIIDAWKVTNLTVSFRCAPYDGDIPARKSY